MNTILPDGRRAGAILATASVLSVVLMTHHPSVASRSMADVVAEVGSSASLARFVHGALIALMAALLFAFVDLSRLLGLRRSTVRAALLAYGIGTMAMIGAALISGFVVPALASAYEGASPPSLESFRGLAILSRVGNRTLASFAVVAMSVAVFLWSLALLRGSRAIAAVGVLGLVVAVGPVLGLATGALRLEVAGMTLVVAGQTVWNLAVSALLLGRRPLPVYGTTRSRTAAPASETPESST